MRARVRSRLVSISVSAALALGAGVMVAGVVLSTAAVADGKSAMDSPYTYDQTWNATLRFVRVDLGMKVTEADRGSGFLLFEYRSSDNGNKAVNASFELIRGSGDSTHVVSQIPQMPRYHEQMLLDRLAQKMREEYGDPPAHRPPPPSVPDAGPDADEDNGSN
jgi:hypothetical protein